MIIPLLFWLNSEGAARPVVSEQSLDATGRGFAHDADETLPAADPCDLWQPGLRLPSNCTAPRKGFLSGFYLGLDVGYATMAAEAAHRDGIGPGAGVHFRVGLEFWDHLIFGVGLAGLIFSDQSPVSEMVVDCTTVNGVVISCDDEPCEQGSSSVGAALLLLASVNREIRRSTA